jgi:hypothetical protein
LVNVLDDGSITELKRATHDVFAVAHLYLENASPEHLIVLRDLISKLMSLIRRIADEKEQKQSVSNVDTLKTTLLLSSQIVDLLTHLSAGLEFEWKALDSEKQKEAAANVERLVSVYVERALRVAPLAAVLPPPPAVVMRGRSVTVKPPQTVRLRATTSSVPKTEQPREALEKLMGVNDLRV